MYIKERQRELRQLSKQMNLLSDDVFDDTAISYLKNLVEKYPQSYFSLLKGNKFLRLRDYIFTHTSFLDKWFKPSIPTRCFYIIKGLTDIIRCNTCGKPYCKQLSYFADLKYFHCNTYCAQQNPEVKSSIDKTKTKHHTHTKDLLEETKKRNNELYGCDWYIQSSEFKKKKDKTWSDKYTGGHPMRDNTIRAKMSEKYFERTGVKHPFQNPDVQAKIISTNIERYGCKYSAASPEITLIRTTNAARTQRKNFYSNFILNYPNVIPLFDEDEYVNAIRVIRNNTGQTVFHEFPWRCKKCGKIFNQRMFKYNGGPRCLDCFPLIYTSGESQFEADCREFILNNLDYERFDPKYKTSFNWSIVKGTNGNANELDLIIVDNKTATPILAFEFNGIFYHSIEQKPLGYHLNKTIQCEDKGIRLIHIWEDEWINDNDHICEFIANVINDVYYYDPIDETIQIIRLSRDKYPNGFSLNGYRLSNVGEPELVEHSSHLGKLTVENTGYLEFTKI